jgi:hypothetical protein
MTAMLHCTDRPDNSGCAAVRAARLKRGELNPERNEASKGTGRSPA